MGSLFAMENLDALLYNRFRKEVSNVSQELLEELDEIIARMLGQSLHLASLKVELVSQESIGASDTWLVRLPNSAYIIGELTTPVLPRDMPMTVVFGW